MKTESIRGARYVGLAAAATLAVGMTTAAAAHAALPERASASVANGTLTIIGTTGDDAIQLSVASDDANTLLVDLGNGTLPQSFARNTFGAIAVFLGRGDDQFAVVRGNPIASQVLTVDGGPGNDTIFGGDGDDTLSGGAGNDTIHGADGADLIFGNGGNDVVLGERGNDTEVLGAGQDSSVWNPGDGSDAVNGNGGTDTLVFNGSNAGEKMSLSANGDRAIFLRDVAAIRMDLDTVEKLDLATLGGADLVTINDLSGTDVKQANIDLSAQGADDGQADVVTVNGTNKADKVNVDAFGAAVDVTGLHTATRITGSAVTNDQLQVNSLGGNDKVAVSDAARALIGVAVDLGTGQR